MGAACGKGTDMPNTDMPKEFPGLGSPDIESDLEAPQQVLAKLGTTHSPDWDSVRPSEMSTSTMDDLAPEEEDAHRMTLEAVEALQPVEEVSPHRSSTSSAAPRPTPPHNGVSVIPLANARGSGGARDLRQMSSTDSSNDDQGPQPDRPASLDSASEWQTQRGSVLFPSQPSERTAADADDRRRLSHFSQPSPEAGATMLAPSFVRREPGAGAATPSAPPARLPPKPEASKAKPPRPRDMPPAKPPPQPSPVLPGSGRPPRALLQSFSSRTPSPHFRQLSVSSMENGVGPQQRRLLASYPHSPSKRIILERSPALEILNRMSPEHSPRRSAEPYQMPSLNLGGRSSPLWSDSSDSDAEDGNTDRQHLVRPITRHKNAVSLTAAWVTQRLDDILASEPRSDSDSDSGKDVPKGTSAAVDALNATGAEGFPKEGGSEMKEGVQGYVRNGREAELAPSESDGTTPAESGVSSSAAEEGPILVHEEAHDRRPSGVSQWVAHRLGSFMSRTESTESSETGDFSDGAPLPPGSPRDWVSPDGGRSMRLKHADSRVSTSDDDEDVMSPRDLNSGDWTTQRMSALLARAESHDSSSPPTSPTAPGAARGFLRRSAPGAGGRRRTMGPQGSSNLGDGILELQMHEERPSELSAAGSSSPEPKEAAAVPPAPAPAAVKASPEPRGFASFLSTVSSVAKLLPTSSSARLEVEDSASDDKDSGSDRSLSPPPPVREALPSQAASRESFRREKLEPNPVLGVEEQAGLFMPWETLPDKSQEQFFAFVNALSAARRHCNALWADVQPEAKEAFAHTMDRDRTRRRGGAYNGDLRQQSVQGEVACSLQEVYAAAARGRYVFRRMLQMSVEEVAAGSSEANGDPKASGGSSKKRNAGDRGTRSGGKVALRWFDEWLVPLKEREKTMEKAEKEYGTREPGPGLAWVHDVLRGQVVCTTVEEMKRTVETVEAYAEGAGGEMVRVKNRLFTPCPTGYRDILVSLRLPIPIPDAAADEDGTPATYSIVAEVQIHLQSFYVASISRRMDCIHDFFRDFFGGHTNARQLHSHLALLETLRVQRERGCDLSVTTNQLIHKDSSATYEDLVLFLSVLQRLEAWEPALRVCVRLLDVTVAETRVHLNPRRSPAVATAVSRIADVLAEMGEWDAGLEKKNEALEIMKAACGTRRHARVLEVMHGVGTFLSRHKRHAEAADMLKDEVELRRVLLGALDPSIASALGDVAQVHLEMRQYPSALDDYHEALEIRRESLGEQSLATAETLNDMGLTLTLLGRFTEAGMRHEEAAEIYDEELTSAHPRAICARMGVARALHSQERLADAVAQCDVLLRGMAPGNQVRLAPYAALVLGHKAELLSLLGETEEAKPAYLAAVEALRRGGGARGLVQGFGVKATSTAGMGILSTGLGLGLGLGIDAALMETLDGLATLYQYELEAHEEAMALHEEVCMLRKERFGPRHPDVAQTLTNMANLHQLMGKEREALPLYREALAIYREALEEGDPLVGITSYNLAILLHDSLEEKFEGRQLARLAEGIFLREGGPGHPYTMMVRETLKAWQMDEGDVEAED